MPRAADDLHPGGVVRQTHGVDDVADLVGGAGGAEELGDLEELLDRHPGDGRHLLRRVAGVVGLHHLEDRLGVGQCRVGLGVGHRLGGRRPAGDRGLRSSGRRPGRRAERLDPTRGARRHPTRAGAHRRESLVVPRHRVVGPGRIVVAGEHPVVEREVRTDDERGIGVQLDVVLVVQLLLEDVVDQPPEEGDVGSRPDRGVEIGDGRRAGVAGVDVDDLRAALVTPDLGPAPAAGVVLRRVGPDDEDHVGVLEIAPVVGHGAPTE